MTDDQKAGLKAAAQVIADEARRLFATWSTKVPETVKVTTRGQSVKVSAGSPAAPAAFFAAKPRNRAPAWANRKSPWHYTGYHDSLSEAAENKLDDAASAWADAVIPDLIDKNLGH